MRAAARAAPAERPPGAVGCVAQTRLRGVVPQDAVAPRRDEHRHHVDRVLLDEQDVVAAVVHEPALLLSEPVQALVGRPVEALLGVVRLLAEDLGRDQRASARRLGQHGPPGRVVERDGARAAVEARLESRRHERDGGLRLTDGEVAEPLARVHDGEARRRRSSIRGVNSTRTARSEQTASCRRPSAELGNKAIVRLLVSDDLSRVGSDRSEGQDDQDGTANCTHQDLAQERRRTGGSP